VHTEREHGGIITSWLMQIVLLLAVVGLVVHEVVAIAVTTTQLDDDGRDVALAALAEYRSGGSRLDARSAAQPVAEEHDAELVAVSADADRVGVVLKRQAPTLVLHRLGPLASVAEVEVEVEIRITDTS